MSDPPSKADAFAEALRAVPLFPLPQVVLMPGALLPLHVFEPRYRRMIRDALDTHRTIAVVQISDLEARDEHGHPAIAAVAGAGTIVDHAELPSGRFNIMVRGRARVRLAELPFEPPYRRARAEILPSNGDGLSSSELSGLLSTVTSFVSLVRARDASFEFRTPNVSEPETFVNFVAQHLLIDGRDRQKALETDRVKDRLAFVRETLALQELSLSAGGGGLAN